MRILALETSTSRGGLALLEDGRLTGEADLPPGLVHGRETSAHLERLLEERGLGPRDLDLLAVSGLPDLLHQPVRYFGKPGLAVSLFGLLLVLSGLALNVDPLVTVTVGVILMSSGTIMWFWGALCEMLLSSSDDPNDLLTSKARYVEMSGRDLVAAP